MVWFWTLCLLRTGVCWCSCDCPRWKRSRIGGKVFIVLRAFWPRVFLSAPLWNNKPGMLQAKAISLMFHVEFCIGKDGDSLNTVVSSWLALICQPVLALALLTHLGPVVVGVKWFLWPGSPLLHHLSHGLSFRWFILSALQLSVPQPHSLIPVFSFFAPLLWVSHESIDYLCWSTF